MEIKISKNEKVLISFESECDQVENGSDSDTTVVESLISEVERLKLELAIQNKKNCELLWDKKRLEQKNRDLQRKIIDMNLEASSGFDPR